METGLSLKEIKKEWHGTLAAYLIGFFICLILTSCSFLSVYLDMFTLQTGIYVLIGLALIQAVCQLLFFLHLGQEAKPRWETLVFYFMVMVLLIVGIGTLWIIFDLDTRVMNMVTH